MYNYFHKKSKKRKITPSNIFTSTVLPYNLNFLCTLGNQSDVSVTSLI